jgi:hypothetical protein
MSDQDDSNSDSDSQRITVEPLDQTVVPRFSPGEQVRIILHPEDGDYERLCGRMATVESIETDGGGTEDNPELSLIYRLCLDSEETASSLLFREPDLRPHDEPDYTELFDRETIAQKVEQYLDENGYPNPY